MRALKSLKAWNKKGAPPKSLEASWDPLKGPDNEFSQVKREGP